MLGEEKEYTQGYKLFNFLQYILDFLAKIKLEVRYIPRVRYHISW